MPTLSATSRDPAGHSPCSQPGPEKGGKQAQAPEPVTASSHVPRLRPLFLTPHVSVMRGRERSSSPPSGQMSQAGPK